MSVSQYVTEIGDVVSHFNITKVQVEDGGVYECIVSNRAGQVSNSAKLQIYGMYYYAWNSVNDLYKLLAGFFKLSLWHFFLIALNLT